MYHGIKIHVYQMVQELHLTTNQQLAFVRYSWATLYEPKPCFLLLKNKEFGLL